MLDLASSKAGCGGCARGPGTGALAFSPEHSCRKFSAAMGASSTNGTNSMRPMASPLICRAPQKHGLHVSRPVGTCTMSNSPADALAANAALYHSCHANDANP